MEDAIAELVRRAHGGEVLGVELFSRLADAQSDPQRRRRLEAVTLLEEQTEAAAERLAQELGIALDDAEDQRHAGREAAKVLAPMDWSSCMQAIADATGGYRALYSELQERIGEPDAHPTIATLLSHERALHAFATAEVGGSPDGLSHLLQALDPAHRARFDAACS